MKKLIAISVMLALVAGAAFAETSVSGYVGTGWTFLQVKDFDPPKSDDGSKNDPIAWTGPKDGGSLINAVELGLSGSDDDGMVSGLINFKWAGWSFGTANSGAWFNRAFIKLKPISQVEFLIGAEGNGMFTNGNNVRWAFHKGGDAMAREDWNAHGYILGHWDGTGVAVTVTPMDLITVMGVLELAGREDVFAKGDTRWEDIWNTGFQFGVDINTGIGKFNVTYRAIETWPTSGKRIGAYYGGSPIDGVEFDLGGNYDLEDDNNPLKLGAAIFYNGDGWGVKTRATIDLNTGTDDDAGFKLDVMPYYGFDFAEVRLNFRWNNSGGDVKNSLWCITPYMVKSLGPCTIQAGIRVGNDNGSGDLPGGVKKNKDGQMEPHVGLQIPISIGFGF